MKLFDNVYNSLLEGLSKGMSLEDIAAKHKTSVESISKELQKGIEVEKEHTRSEETAKKIAMDHLVEHPNYYSKLAKAKL